nr:Chain C, Md3-C9 peptide derived from Membrane glycoprotein [SARS coronavirus TJF]
LACFVLAAV